MKLRHFGLIRPPSHECMRVYTDSFHSGGQPLTSGVTSTASTHAFAAALKEYEENTEMERRVMGRMEIRIFF